MRLRIAITASLVLGTLCTAAPAVSQATVPPVFKGIWIDKAELDSIPTSGTGWDRMKSAADGSWGTAEIKDNNSNHDINTLAGALVFARLYPDPAAEPYRQRVADALMEAIGTEERASNETALGRNLNSYVIAADLINFRAYQPEREAIWRQWLTDVRFAPFVGSYSLVDLHEIRLTNHGTVSGASRIAADIYLGDTVDLNRAADVLHGYFGNQSAYNGFVFSGSRDWFCDETKLIGVNPAGCTKQIDGAPRNVDGVLPAEQHRCGSATWPPCKTQYPWGGLQGVLIQAELLNRQGFPSLTWEDNALERVYEWLWFIEGVDPGWWILGDNEWQAPVVNYLFCTDYPEFSETRNGKIMGWTEFTHTTRRSDCGGPPPPPPPNSAPSAADGSTSTPQDTAVTVTLTATDQEDCELGFSVVTPPTSGTLSPLTNQPCSTGSPNSDSAELTYTPNTGFTGGDSFTFKANDGEFDSNTATVTISVTEPGAGGDISFVAASSAANATATTLTINKPQGVTAGQVLVATVSVRGKPRVTPPPGFTLVRSDVNGSALKLETYYRVATSSEPASYTWTLPDARGAAGGIAAFSGVDTANPVDASGGQINASSTSVSAPSITTTVPDTMLLGSFAIRGTTALAPPPSMSERWDLASTGSSKITSSGATEARASSSATGERIASAKKGAPSIGHLVALRPGQP